MVTGKVIEYIVNWSLVCDNMPRVIRHMHEDLPLNSLFIFWNWNGMEFLKMILIEYLFTYNLNN